MYERIVFKPKKKVSVTDIITYKDSSRIDEMLYSFLDETKRCYCTSMKFPPRVASSREQQVQRQNYDLFVNTMAEMIKKYAPEITE